MVIEGLGLSLATALVDCANVETSGSSLSETDATLVCHVTTLHVHTPQHSPTVANMHVPPNGSVGMKHIQRPQISQAVSKLHLDRATLADTVEELRADRQNLQAELHAQLSSHSLQLSAAAVTIADVQARLEDSQQVIWQALDQVISCTSAH